MHAVTESRPGSSALSLVIANLVAIVLAVFEGWDLGELMLVYWAQSVIIGYFNVRRILDLNEFSTANFQINDVQPPANEQTKRSTAFFFAFHYGFFHAIYLLFLLSGDIFGGQRFQGSWLMFAVCVVVFFLNHRYSYLHNKEQDESRKPNIGSIMFFPYVRIVPMHLTIIAGGAIGTTTTPALLLFLGLKTAADLVMHEIEHARWRR